MDPNEVWFLSNTDEFAATIFGDQSPADVASRWVSSHGTILQPRTDLGRITRHNAPRPSISSTAFARLLPSLERLP